MRGQLRVPQLSIMLWKCQRNFATGWSQQQQREFPPLLQAHTLRAKIQPPAATQRHQDFFVLNERACLSNQIVFHIPKVSPFNLPLISIKSFAIPNSGRRFPYKVHPLVSLMKVARSFGAAPRSRSLSRKTSTVPLYSSLTRASSIFYRVGIAVYNPTVSPT